MDNILPFYFLLLFYCGRCGIVVKHTAIAAALSGCACMRCAVAGTLCWCSRSSALALVFALAPAPAPAPAPVLVTVPALVLVFVELELLIL